MTNETLERANKTAATIAHLKTVKARVLSGEFLNRLMPLPVEILAAGQTALLPLIDSAIAAAEKELAEM